jgi:hypothetical protein
MCIERFDGDILVEGYIEKAAARSLHAD